MLINIESYIPGEYKTSRLSAMKIVTEDQGHKLKKPITKLEKEQSENYFTHNITFDGWNTGQASDHSDDQPFDDFIRECDGTYMNEDDYNWKSHLRGKAVCIISCYRQPGDNLVMPEPVKFRYFSDKLKGKAFGKTVFESLKHHMKEEHRNPLYALMELQTKVPEPKDTRSTAEKLVGIKTREAANDEPKTTSKSS